MAAVQSSEVAERAAERRMDVLNISMAGAAGLYKSVAHPVEPVTKAGQQWQQEQQGQTPFGRELEEEFMNSLASGVCPNCGNPVYQNPRGRKKKFCCEACRFAWKNKHPRPENWSSSRTAVCPVCGKQFLASREYQNKRKYCSRACANTGRAANKRTSAE